MDNKLFMEMLGLTGDHELAHLDDKALDSLKSALFNELGLSHDTVKLTDEQIKKMKEERIFKEQFQKKLLDQPLNDSIFKHDKGPKQGHGLTQLCHLNVQGYSEKILKLSEVFMPPKDDD